MELRRDIVAKQTEQSFLLDLYGSLVGKVLARIRGWPSGIDLGVELTEWEARLSVGLEDLMSTRLFSSSHSVGSFLKYYKRYDFLDPIPVSTFGIAPTETTRWLSIVNVPNDDTGMMMIRLGELLERKIIHQAGKPRLSQRQEVEQALQVVEERRKTRRGSDGNRALGSDVAASTVALQAIHQHVQALKTQAEIVSMAIVSMTQEMLSPEQLVSSPHSPLQDSRSLHVTTPRENLQVERRDVGTSRASLQMQTAGLIKQRTLSTSVELLGEQRDPIRTSVRVLPLTQAREA